MTSPAFFFINKLWRLKSVHKKHPFQSCWQASPEVSPTLLPQAFVPPRCSEVTEAARTWRLRDNGGPSEAVVVALVVVIVVVGGGGDGVGWGGGSVSRSSSSLPAPTVVVRPQHTCMNDHTVPGGGLARTR